MARKKKKDWPSDPAARFLLAKNREALGAHPGQVRSTLTLGIKVRGDGLTPLFNLSLLIPTFGKLRDWWTAVEWVTKAWMEDRLQVGAAGVTFVCGGCGKKRKEMG